jgi:oxalate decarboxylase/phosphoglucose isomerase-like protein (cupin superfamily)
LLVSTLNAAPAPYTVDNQADTIITLSNDDEVYSITALSTNETNDYKTGEIEFIQTTSDLRVKVTIIQKNKPMLQGFSPGFSSGFSS